MQTVEHLRELFIYNDWANRRIVAALKLNQSEKARKILAHLLITEQEYFERLYGKDSFGFDFWQDLSLAECGDLARETARFAAGEIADLGARDQRVHRGRLGALGWRRCRCRRRGQDRAWRRLQQQLVGVDLVLEARRFAFACLEIAEHALAVGEQQGIEAQQGPEDKFQHRLSRSGV